MATKLNIDTITNALIRKKLGLNNIMECHFDIFPIEVLVRYFGEYELCPPKHTGPETSSTPSFAK